jgi:hypothetical protein
MKRVLALAVVTAVLLVSTPALAGNHGAGRNVSGSTGTTDAANFGEIKSGVTNPSPVVDPPAEGANVSVTGPIVPCDVEAADGCIDIP